MEAGKAEPRREGSFMEDGSEKKWDQRTQKKRKKKLDGRLAQGARNRGKKRAGVRSRGGLGLEGRRRILQGAPDQPSGQRKRDLQPPRGRGGGRDKQILSGEGCGRGPTLYKKRAESEAGRT